MARSVRATDVPEDDIDLVMECAKDCITMHLSLLSRAIPKLLESTNGGP